MLLCLQSSKTVTVGDYVITGVLGKGSFATVCVGVGTCPVPVSTSPPGGASVSQSYLTHGVCIPLWCGILALHQVYKGYSKITGLDVAVKVISIRRLDRKAQANLESEISILRRTRHENIVRLLDVQVRQAAERPRVDDGVFCVQARWRCGTTETARRLRCSARNGGGWCTVGT